MKWYFIFYKGPLTHIQRRHLQKYYTESATSNWWKFPSVFFHAYWKWIFPISPSVRRSVGRSVYLSDGCWSVIISMYIYNISKVLTNIYIQRIRFLLWMEWKAISPTLLSISRQKDKHPLESGSSNITFMHPYNRPFSYLSPSHLQNGPSMRSFFF